MTRAPAVNRSPRMYTVIASVPATMAGGSTACTSGGGGSTTVENGAEPWPSGFNTRSGRLPGLAVSRTVTAKVIRVSETTVTAPTRTSAVP